MTRKYFNWDFLFIINCPNNIKLYNYFAAAVAFSSSRILSFFIGPMNAALSATVWKRPWPNLDEVSMNFKLILSKAARFVCTNKDYKQNLNMINICINWNHEWLRAIRKNSFNTQKLWPQSYQCVKHEQSLVFHEKIGSKMLYIIGHF